MSLPTSSELDRREAIVEGRLGLLYLAETRARVSSFLLLMERVMRSEERDRNGKLRVVPIQQWALSEGRDVQLQEDSVREARYSPDVEGGEPESEGSGWAGGSGEGDSRYLGGDAGDDSRIEGVGDVGGGDSFGDWEETVVLEGEGDVVVEVEDRGFDGFKEG